MRIRLTVQRNELPAVNILWNVPETKSTQAYTITRLLEDVNAIVPLETELWGLEQYVVEVAGFECLHFTPVIGSLKEEDHVCIRPLMTAEIRARALTGRHQISDDGRHLVDGIPFGRPYLKEPNRPSVRIPPRKRRRLDNGVADNETEIAGLLTSGSEEARENHVRWAALPSRDEETNGDWSGPHPAGSADESDDDDEDFATDSESTSDESSVAGSDQELGSDSDSDSSSAASSNDSESSSSDSGSSSDSDSDSDSDDEAMSPPDTLSSKALPGKPLVIPHLAHTPPGEGRKSTKNRNIRRVRNNRLRTLKAEGILHQDANFQDLEEYENAQNDRDNGYVATSAPLASSSGKRKRSDEGEAGSTTIDNISELIAKRKRELMGELDNGMLAPAGDETTLAQKSPASPVPVSNSTQGQPEAQTPEKSAPTRRLRPDTTAIGRILARQAQSSAKKPKRDSTPEKVEETVDPDFWKSKINLSAFECWEEEFELSAPPFPFEQHWDPASKKMRELAAAKKKKSKKGTTKAKINGSKNPVEEDDEEQIILNYDESTEITPVSPGTEQIQDDASNTCQADLPALPSDVSTLPDLTSSDIRKNAVIVCKFFGVNPRTITPEISKYKTAIVDREGDSGNGAGTIRLLIAERDLPKKQKIYDKKGNRMYDAGEGFFVDDQDDDNNDGVWEGQFNELLEAKLLRAA